ncbi:MAG: histidine kinase [Saprospirales bacterium]|nr:histidine kinase [Saprospirales bacterium]
MYRNRVERIRKKEEMLRKEAEVRQQMAETETAILRLQMNPHFIFNSMNSINAYILKKDINTASDYLGRFAKLMRMILDLAAKPLIPVSDEIELLKLYLQTEAMRFEHKFSYVFEVDESLDPDDVVLPTMILQPFVENAIWHGLSNKKGEGLIRISFKKENEMLHCVVEDNGIGRDAALHSKSGVTVHESKAMSITLRRLELLEKTQTKSQLPGSRPGRTRGSGQRHRDCVKPSFFCNQDTPSFLQIASSFVQNQCRIILHWPPSFLPLTLFSK